MQYTSILDAVVQISRREGVGGYYKGMRTKIVQSVLAAALLFMCKEKITDATRELLGTARKNQNQSVQVAKR
jgi:adenine nucleotide transporter 17